VTLSSRHRLIAGTFVLIVSGATGLVAWSVQPCIDGSTGALWLGVVTLVANILAWLLIGRRMPSKLVLFVGLLPALAALSYTLSTIQLASGHFGDGLSACSVLRPGQEFPADGREPLFITLWFLVCTSFWGGLVPVALRAIRVYAGPSNNE
jgi:hypothetical protein